MIEQQQRREPEYGSDLVVELLHTLGIEYAAFNPGASFRGLHDSLGAETVAAAGRKQRAEWENPCQAGAVPLGALGLALRGVLDGDDWVLPNNGLRMAEHRGRPAERAGIGTRPEGPVVDFATVARGFGIAAAGPITSVEDLPQALATAVEAVASGEPYLLDVVTEAR